MRKTPDFSLFTKYWQLKLLSLLIGTGLWYFVAAEDRLDLTVTIPLELRNLPASLVVANQYKKEIEVAISGPRRLVQDMRQQNISRPVDLSKAEPGALVVKNDADSIRLPRGIQVQRVQPANITLSIDRLLSKDFPIIPVTKGKPSSGFVVDSLAARPPKITITGPQTVLEQENLLKTVPINIEGVDSSSAHQAHLSLNEPLLRLVGETVIEVQVILREAMVKKTVRAIPIKTGTGPTTGRFIPDTVTVVAEISERVVQSTPDLTSLFQATPVKSPDKAGNEVHVQVRPIPVPGHPPVVIQSIKPETVRVRP